MFVAVAPADAGSPGVTISASATAGSAPLTVSFEAQGDAASYHWDLGNGATADGASASATYGPGLWTVTVTATAADGGTAQASVTVRSVAINLQPPAAGRYGMPASFRGTVVPALADEPVALYVGEREVANTFAAADGTFQLNLKRVQTPGSYEARTPVAASAPVTFDVHPVLQAAFVGTRAVSVGGRLALAARVVPAAAGALSIRLYRDGKLVRTTRAQGAARLVLATGRAASYRAVVGVEPAQGWLGAERAERALVCATVPGEGLVHYGGAGQEVQPLLSFAALNTLVTEKNWCAVRALASALTSRAVRSGAAAYWEYDFPFQGGPVPWRSGFAQAVAAQALARAGVLLQDPMLSAAANAAFRGLRGPLLMPLAGGAWVREYSFTNQVILNAQLQSIISLGSYAAVADSVSGRRLSQKLALAAERLLPRFDLGCWASYQLGGGRASLHYETYHVELLRQLAATRPEPIWRRTYLRWRRCLPGHASERHLVGESATFAAG
jgi:PKD repeat protein